MLASIRNTAENIKGKIPTTQIKKNLSSRPLSDETVRRINKPAIMVASTWSRSLLPISVRLFVVGVDDVGS